MLKGKITVTTQHLPSKTKINTHDERKRNKKIRKEKIKQYRKSALELIDAGQQQHHQQEHYVEKQQNEQLINNQHQYHGYQYQIIKQKQMIKNLSICFPDSILQIPQSSVLRAYFISQVARISSIFKVNQIIILTNHGSNTKSQNFNYSQYIARNLQYLETPQYLRKHLFKMHPDLKNAGLMNPIECHHHLKSDDICEFREGVSLDRPTKPGAGSWVDIGLKQQARMDCAVLPNTRVTLRLKNYQNQDVSFYQAQAISKRVPQLEKNLYWGYNVRIADNFSQVFSSQQYQIKIICNSQQPITQLPTITDFQNLSLVDKSILIFLSGVDEISALMTGNRKNVGNREDILEKFDYLFGFENFGVQKLRMEEQLFIVLCRLGKIVN